MRKYCDEIDEAELREFEAGCFVEEPEQGYAAEKSPEMERATKPEGASRNWLAFVDLGAKLAAWKA